MKPAKSSAAVILATLLMGFRRSVGSRAVPSEPERLSEKDPIEVSFPVEIEIYHYYREDADDLEEFKEEMEEAFNSKPLLEMAVAAGNMPEGTEMAEGFTNAFGAGVPAFINEVIVGVRLEIEDLWETVDRKVEQIRGIKDLNAKLRDYDCRYGGDDDYDRDLYEEQLTDIPMGFEEGWFDTIIAEDPTLKLKLESLGEHGFLDADGYVQVRLDPKLTAWVHDALDGAIEYHSERSPGDFLIAQCVTSGTQEGTVIKGKLVFSLRRNPRLRTSASTDVTWRMERQIKETVRGLQEYLNEKWFRSWNGHSPLEWMRISLDDSAHIHHTLARISPHGKVRRR